MTQSALSCIKAFLSGEHTHIYGYAEIVTPGNDRVTSAINNAAKDSDESNIMQDNDYFIITSNDSLLTTICDYSIDCITEINLVRSKEHLFLKLC